jgi:hypothetical protein
MQYWTGDWGNVTVQRSGSWWLFPMDKLNVMPFVYLEDRASQKLHHYFMAISHFNNSIPHLLLVQ